MHFKSCKIECEYKTPVPKSGHIYVGVNGYIIIHTYIRTYIHMHIHRNLVYLKHVHNYCTYTYGSECMCVQNVLLQGMVILVGSIYYVIYCFTLLYLPCDR